MIKIQFNWKPSPTVRETLRVYGFHYDTHTRTWYGKDTEVNRMLIETLKEDRS